MVVKVLLGLRQRSTRKRANESTNLLQVIIFPEITYFLTHLCLTL